MQEKFENSARNDVLHRADEAAYPVARLYRVGAMACAQALKDDVRMPRTINYLERYQAFLRMQDRSVMLKRLEQTIDLASTILDNVPKLDPDAACREAACALRQDLQVTAEVEVVPELDGLDLEELGAEQPGFKGAKPVIRSLDSVLRATYSENAGEFSQKTEQEVSQEEFEALCDRLYSKLDNAYYAFVEEQAAQVVGKHMDPQELPTYAGTVSFEMRYDVGEVRLLLEQVQKSFATFKQVVMDNGLFAAFVKESAYGQCSGYRYGWTSDFGDEVVCEYFGAKPRNIVTRALPSAVEEDDGGDTVLRAVGRMREFNAKPYFGMLDDDFIYHVEAFWYGFRKLMEFVNDLVDVSLGDYNDYLMLLLETLRDQAKRLGAQMNMLQLTQWGRAFEELARQLEKRAEAGAGV